MRACLVCGNESRGTFCGFDCFWHQCGGSLAGFGRNLRTAVEASRADPAKHVIGCAQGDHCRCVIPFG